jgi:hypothetical protein
MATESQTDDFDIGKAIFEQLKELSPERQERILRWVAEALGRRVAAIGIPGSPSGPVGASPTDARTSDIKSFVAAKAPQSDNHFAAAVAYYYRFEAESSLRRDSIDAGTLQDAARLAGRKRLANPRATLNNAKSVGYLDAAARGEFSINSVGENLVAMALPGGTSPISRAPRKKKRGK